MSEERKERPKEISYEYSKNEANYFVYEFVCLKQKKNALGKGLQFLLTPDRCN